MKFALVVVAATIVALGAAQADEVCTPADITVECGHEACAGHEPGSCFEITELSRSLIPDMRKCYAEHYPDLVDAAILWNERVNRGIQCRRD